MEMKGTDCRQLEEQQTQKAVFPFACSFTSQHRGSRSLWTDSKELQSHLGPSCSLRRSPGWCYSPCTPGTRDDLQRRHGEKSRVYLGCSVWPPQERWWRRARQRQKGRRKPQGRSCSPWVYCFAPPQPVLSLC